MIGCFLFCFFAYHVPPMESLALDESRSGGLKHVLRMSWPASLTMLNSTALRFVDGWMVSRVGPLPFAAQYVAGMTSFIPESFLTGVLTVVNTYVSQNYGAGRLDRTSQYAWAGLRVAVLAGLLIAPLALVAWPMFRLFASLGREGPINAELVALEVVYFRYMVLSAALTLACRVLEQFFYGVHRPRVVLAASIACNLFNVGANYVLIYGRLGFPALGLEGAAIGTVLSWALQFAILFSVFLSRPLRQAYQTHKLGHVPWAMSREIFRLGWPAGVQLSNDIATWSVFSVAMVGVFGEVHLAATTAVMRYLGLSFMPAVGIGMAATAIVGRCIGHHRPDLARQRTHIAVATAMVYMGLCGIAFWLFRRPMIAFFIHLAPGAGDGEAADIAQRIIDIGSTLMILAAMFQLFDAVGIVYVGALRGAGDTFWPMIATFAVSWIVLIGGGLLAIRIEPRLESVGPWIAATAYVVLLGLLVAWRFESGKWRKIRLLNRSAAALDA